MSLVKFNNGTRSAVPYFNNVLDTLFSDALNKNFGVSKVPAVNVAEAVDHFEIELVAPGFNKEDFKVDLDKDKLTISGAIAEVNQAEKGYTRKEFEHQAFSRSFVLPESIDNEKISASYVNGILSVKIGKKEKTKEEKKEITVS